MGYKIGELFWKILADTSSFKSEIKKSETQTKSLGSTVSTTAKLMKIAMTSAAVVGAAALTRELISAASTAEETRNKFNVVFSDVSDAAETAAENLSDGFGLSQQAAEDLLSGTGDLLSGFGFTQDAALDLSTQVNELAGDLASFQNVDTVAASDAITKALLGERESVKQLGISILDADVNARVFELTQQGITFESERQAKAFATLQLAQEQSKNAIGDYERSQNSFANQTREAQAAISDLKVAMGEGLLPIATQSVSIFAGLTQKLADFITERQRLKELRESDTSDLDENDKIDKYALLIEDAKERIYALNDAKAASIGYGKETLDSIEAEITAQKNLISSLEQKQEAAKAAADLMATYTGNAKEAAEEQARLDAEAAEAAKEAAEEEKELLSELEEYKAELKQTSLDYVAELDEEEAERKKSALENEISLAMEHNQQLIDEEQARADAVVAIREAELSSTASILGSMSSIFGEFADDNTEAAIAEKALASAQAAINSYLAFTQVLASAEVPALAKPIVAAAVLASGLAQQASILSTEIPGYEDGGIVGGSSYTGDNVITAQNSGEMNINRADQQTLFNAIKSGNLGSSGGTFIMEVDGQALATILVNKINDGQGGTISGRVIS
jgi:hypothetical protein